MSPYEKIIFDNCDAIDNKFIKRIKEMKSPTEVELLQLDILERSIIARKFLRKRKGGNAKAQKLQGEIAKLNEKLAFLLLISQNDKAA